VVICIYANLKSLTRKGNYPCDIFFAPKRKSEWIQTTPI